MNSKIGWIGAAALGLLGATTGQALAVPSAPSCSTISSVGAFEAATGGCIVGDKLFTMTADSNLPDGTILSISQIGLTYALAQFVIQVGGDYTFNYSVEVISPDFKIVQVDIDSTVAGDDVAVAQTYVQKKIYNASLGLIDTITSTAGGIDESVQFSEDKIFIEEFIHLVNSGDGEGGQPDAAFQSISNDIIQAPTIPEPATLGLLGFALVGVGMLRRKMAK